MFLSLINTDIFSNLHASSACVEKTTSWPMAAKGHLAQLCEFAHLAHLAKPPDEVERSL
jgi:hypothetical protein